MKGKILRFLASGVAATLELGKYGVTLVMLEIFSFNTICFIIIFLILILQPSWVTDEEFGRGYLELKLAPSVTSKSNAAAYKEGLG